MNTSVFVSAGIAGGVLLTCAALHITYLGMRAKRESEAMLRRARYPWWVLVIVDIFLVGFGSFFAFVLSVILTPSAGIPIVIVLFAVPMFLIFALFIFIILLIRGLTIRYIELVPSGFVFRSGFGRVHNIPFSDIKGYDYRPARFDFEGTLRMSLGDRHAVNTSRGDRLRVINHEGKKILQTQVRHSAMPDYVGQCLMFRGMQERWPQLGYSEDEKILAEYTKDVVVRYLTVNRWRQDF